MRKVIGAINMTLDGFCDHTTSIADEEIHDHYTALLRSAGVILYGRITYQLMQYWQPLLKNPTGNKSMDDFAIAIDQVPKIVFSNTLTDAASVTADWPTARLAKNKLQEEVQEIRQQTGKDILVGSRSIIVTLMNLGLIDEFQICVQPIIAAKGLSLLENITDRIDLKLLKTKTFSSSGSMLFYYKPLNK